MPSLRPARPADLAALLPLLRAFYAEEGLTLHPRVEAALADLLSEPRHGRLFVAERGGALVGYVALTYGYSLELGGKDAFVDELFVTPSARGQGIGRALLAAALAGARELGVGQVLLEVAEPDAAKLAFYAAAGFAPRPHPLMVCRL